MERRQFTRQFKLEAVRLIKDRGVSYVQASEDLGVHTSQLRDWVKKLADDPPHAFPGNGQMKPEQLEIARLKRGQNEGVFNSNLSVDNLYLTLVAMSMFYFTHAYTLSAILEYDLLDDKSVKAWQRNVETVVLSMIQPHR